MRTIFLSLIIPIYLLSVTSLHAADREDKVLIRIDDREITKSEFLDVYRKNNIESFVAEPKEVDEYLHMYVNFRLKVKAAKAQGLDTVSSFVDELKGYREQLAQKYLVDHDVTEKLIKEAWERSQYDVRASHILINLPAYAAPEDTMEVYQKLLELRERILSGEAFGDLARKYSDDSLADDQPAAGNRPARRGNEGDLGYFTVFNMVYPFETAAYNTEPGDVSMPVRTSFGYHIVKVTNRIPAIGQAKVAHIMLMTPDNISEEELEGKEQLIYELHKKLTDDEALFEELVSEYSEDRRSAQRGGEMPPFTSNRMVPQFIEKISEMHETGQISEPVRSDFGWHIIKLLEKNPPPDFEEAYADLQNRMQRETRSELSQEVVIERLKKEYQFEKNTDALMALDKVVDERIFQGKWDPEAATGMDDFIFGFADNKYTQEDFVQYLDANQRNHNLTSIPGLLYKYLDKMVTEEILDYEKQNLEKKYPEFKKVMQEYHDGILLFEITNQEVWSKATTDSTGLEMFFEKHREKYDAEGVSEIRGKVIADYQQYLEKKWLDRLREEYEVWINDDLLESIKSAQ